MKAGLSTASLAMRLPRSFSCCCSQPRTPSPLCLRAPHGACESLIPWYTRLQLEASMDRDGFDFKAIDSENFDCCYVQTAPMSANITSWRLKLILLSKS